MSQAEKPSVRERVSVNVSRVGVAPEIEAALAALSVEQLAARCRTARDELAALESPSVVLDRAVAVSLVAACWTLAADAEAKAECRNRLSLVTRQAGPKVLLNRSALVRLLTRVVGAHQ